MSVRRLSFSTYVRRLLAAGRNLLWALWPGEREAYFQPSYSQEGEDMILRRLFEVERRTKGYYVDIGAHHPQRFSNTYFLYRQGWCGINVDAMPGSMQRFQRIRPGDINLELAVSASQETLTYYAFKDPALNTFSARMAEEYRAIAPVLFEKEIRTFTLADVLERYLPPNQPIDLLNIDVEGLDYQVLVSNNWERYRPRVVLIEELGQVNLAHLADSPCYRFLTQQGYALAAKTVNTMIFQHQS